MKVICKHFVHKHPSLCKPHSLSDLLILISNARKLNSQVNRQRVLLTNFIQEHLPHFYNDSLISSRSSLVWGEQAGFVS